MKKTLYTFLILGSLLCAETSHAALLTMTSETESISRGETFQVDMWLDNDSQTINAVEGKLIFPRDILEISEIQTHDSVIDLWLEKEDESRGDRGSFSFAGIMPGGFNGVLSPSHKEPQPGNVFSIIFKAKKEGIVSIEIDQARVLLHDGLATPAPLELSSHTVNVTASVSNVRDLITSKTVKMVGTSIAGLLAIVYIARVVLRYLWRVVVIWYMKR